MGVTTSVQYGGVNNNYEHTWVHSQPYAALPPYAVVGGHDCDGAPIYVGRAYHDGDQLPAKVVPSKGCAYIAYCGLEHTKPNYEILVGQGYAWIPCFGGNVPPNAVRSGFTRGGEPLYVGRGQHANSLCVGKIHSSHGCLYIPFGGMEVRISTYEVLVRQHQDNWVASSVNYTPPGAVVAGHDTDRDVIYVSRAMHNGEMLPAKFVPCKGSAYVCYGGYEINKQQIEVLCGYGYSWAKSHHHSIPPNAVSTDTFKWVHSSAYASIPPDAIPGGNDTDGAIIYVGRAFHNSDTIVAKVMPSKHIAFVTWRGEVIPKEHFEILCGTNLIWRHCYDHIIPENAISCGETSLGQAVYIGRGHYNGSLTVGKISSVHRALFIAYGGMEKRLESYEILVHEKVATPGWTIPTTFEEKKPFAPPEDFEPMTPPPPPPPPPYTASIPTATVIPQSFGSDPPPPYAPFTYTPEPGLKPSYVPNYEAIPEKKYSFTDSYAPPVMKPTMPQLGIHLSYAPNYEAIPEKKYSFTDSYAPPLMNPPFLGTTITPATTYVPSSAPAFTPADVYVPPTVPSSGFDIWIDANDNYTPPNAYRAGQDTDLSSLYVCRAFHNGHMLPGKANPSHRCAYVSCDGQEIRKYNFEILVGDRYHWVPAYNGNIPPGAVEGGRTANGEVLFIGRSYYNGSQTPGKIHPSHGCLYIPYGGQEIRLENYEVLVRW